VGAAAHEVTEIKTRAAVASSFNAFIDDSPQKGFPLIFSHNIFPGDDLRKGSLTPPLRTGYRTKLNHTASLPNQSIGTLTDKYFNRTRNPASRRRRFM
jgi:hypothetical protein